MKKRGNRVCSFLPVLVILLMLGFAGFNPVYALNGADSSTVGEKVPVESVSYSWTSPFAVDRKLPAQLPSSHTLAAVSTVNSLEALQEEIEENLYQRQTSFQIHYTGDTSNMENDINEILDRIFAADDYLANSMDSWGWGYNGYENDIDISFTCAYLTTREQEDFVEQEVSRILGDVISPDMSNDEKEAAIHNYIVSHVAYDETLSEHSAYAALAYGYTVCQGYALLAYTMLQEAGVECRIITGDAPGPHAWNMVQLDGEWYHLDVTHDDPVPDEPGRLTFDYYNLNNIQIVEDHSWITGDYPTASSVYYEVLLDKIDNNPAGAGEIRELMREIDLHYVLDEYTAATVEELRQEIRQSLQYQNNTFCIRTLPGVYEVFDLGEIYSYDNAPSSIYYSSSEYLRTPAEGDGDGDLLLELNFTYQNTVSSLSLDRNALGLETGESYNIQATARFTSGSSSDVTAMARYESSNSEVATVDEAGKITAVAAGEAIITVGYGGQEASCTLTVAGTVIPDFSGIEWGHNPVMPADYDWTIEFNKAVNPDTVNADNIYVLNSHGIKEDIVAQLKAGSDGKEVLVPAPTNGYQPGEYWLYIESGLYSGNQSLAQAVRMKFTISNQ